ncbi:hypothetical protein SKDZ_05G0620 [Saccharomyces kudriavzevii ZP591]|nr:hypothetical protein SKDZ_05G0620 [Saccharomyces kudriavzevii ZP591]
MHFISRRSSKALQSNWLEIGARKGGACMSLQAFDDVRHDKNSFLQDAGGVRDYKMYGCSTRPCMQMCIKASTNNEHDKENLM